MFLGFSSAVCDVLLTGVVQTIDYEGFHRFMYIYLDSADMPDELYRHLFLSFIKRPSSTSAVLGGRSNGDVVGLDVVPHESPSRLHGLAGKLHGLTEKLHNLGGSVAPPGRRHRAGTHGTRHCQHSMTEPGV